VTYGVGLAGKLLVTRRQMAIFFFALSLALGQIHNAQWGQVSTTWLLGEPGSSLGIQDSKTYNNNNPKDS